MTFSNARRRRDVLVFMTMVGTAAGIVSERQNFKTVNVHTMLANFMKIVKAHERAVPDKHLRAKEQNASKVVVNTILSPQFSNWRGEVQLWMACQVARRMIASGWEPEKSEEVMDFMQSLYALSQNFPVIDAPPENIQMLAEMSPEMFRAAGFFR